ncbi:MAG: hypothetical protein K0R51_278 [Cytophagaceae bacterium]|jgi:hypothetical protein|nr:hypothetical protein [Cytophagaceae bacterium]
MSIIKDQEVSLPTIILQANLIVEVRCIDTFEEEVLVLSDDKKEGVKPFIKKGLVYQVTSILKNTTDHPMAVDTRIRVPHENWRRSFSQHKEAYAGGPSKSFTVTSYTTEVPSMAEAGILFLHAFKDTYQLVSKNAFEQTIKKEQIEGLIGIV